MLEVRNISSGYGKKQVLFDVSIEVNPGEIVLLTGGNGSGKSTLLKCIYSLLPLWQGQIFFDGKRIDTKKPSDLIGLGIVYIPQKDFCFENLTVEENLKIAGNLLKKKELSVAIHNVYDQLALEPFKKRKPFHLSGGEKKLLALGMCLIHQPRLILFDEPLAGVDASKTEMILKIFNSIFSKNNLSVVIVEHKDSARELFNRKIELVLGKLSSK
jgi:branched-chain amino acid transport system ATP-binding protein